MWKTWSVCIRSSSHLLSHFTVSSKTKGQLRIHLERQASPSGGRVMPNLLTLDTDLGRRVLWRSLKNSCMWREGRHNMTQCTQAREGDHSTPAAGGGLEMDNGLTWSLTTCNVSCPKVVMKNNSSTASMKDCSSVKSRSFTATSAAVRCWASNGHRRQWNGQRQKKKHINTKIGKPIYNNVLAS